MTKPTPQQVIQSGLNRTATGKELEAAQLVFEAEVYRGDPARLARATEAAHAALQNHLDAIASNLAVARRSLGI
ncbi:hypothetical protein [Phenylobacterium sp. 58.2.17]|uniref:hypothetical protein n=1 Tax=Phenylobacterium sp. 58.2.17 TaxID=2969306 RepID=UPI002264BD17|nr:hypothetical protein [Phenylobacterium sp. 58.2.17]MCX7585033.1 hypothetical protein [Phenylobacterium sp. 58.2.17]